MIDGAYFGDDPAAAATPGALGAASAQGTNGVPGCPTPRGTWPPPAPGPHGHTTKQLTYTYQAARRLSRSTSWRRAARATTPAALGDPYASKASSITQTLNVDQPPPPPTIPPTVPPTDPPPTTTTTPGSGTF